MSDTGYTLLDGSDPGEIWVLYDVPTLLQSFMGAWEGFALSEDVLGSWFLDEGQDADYHFAAEFTFYETATFPVPLDMPVWFKWAYDFRVQVSWEHDEPVIDATLTPRISVLAGIPLSQDALPRDIIYLSPGDLDHGGLTRGVATPSPIVAEKFPIPGHPARWQFVIAQDITTVTFNCPVWRPGGIGRTVRRWPQSFRRAFQNSGPQGGLRVGERMIPGRTDVFLDITGIIGTVTSSAGLTESGQQALIQVAWGIKRSTLAEFGIWTRAFQCADGSVWLFWMDANGTGVWSRKTNDEEWEDEVLIWDGPEYRYYDVALDIGGTFISVAVKVTPEAYLLYFKRCGLDGEWPANADATLIPRHQYDFSTFLAPPRIIDVNGTIQIAVPGGGYLSFDGGKTWEPPRQI